MNSKEALIFKKNIDGFYELSEWTRFLKDIPSYKFPISVYQTLHNGEIPDWVKCFHERNIWSANTRFILSLTDFNPAFSEKETFQSQDGIVTIIRFIHPGFVRRSIEIYYPLSGGNYIGREETRFREGKWKVTWSEKLLKNEVDKYTRQWDKPLVAQCY